MKRCAGVLAVVSAMWLAVALVAPTASAAVDTADVSIPVDPATSLEMHSTANCIAAEAKCLFDARANLRRGPDILGFPGDLWARQTTTLRTMDRGVYINFNFDAPNTRSFKSLTDVEFTTIYFGGGPPEKFQFRGIAWPVDARTGGPRTDVPLIVCSHIQVVYAGVNVTSPDACAQAAFS
ncbi:hypothetical protein A5765_08700 [Mycolicibacterium celeriflavum]|uniref:Uncharacterized protein n=2 Tax=Mycolicibacterium celeriflavum TaxID=1249101 RepID=A0A1X0BRA8_MYCCF|nr:hypothetical protein A5765_08700 [Mycolicibacterium celeriflavum]ORA45836.1 hypothetical protein BST21_16735 [Mycolicibacterium celeriflavum]BBY45475.1 hypothetical protein MCEL_37700 [Mycolicibacterium celeriflavum]